MLLSARIEPNWMANAAAPILARNILLLCRIFGSQKRQHLPMLSITSKSVAWYKLLPIRALGRPTVTGNPPPGEKRRFFSPISSTLIHGQRDAALVDTFMTVNQNDVLVDWVKASGKNLTTIYIPHGHGDHWFGIGALLERFPSARAVASPAVVNMMKEQTPEKLKLWRQEQFPGRIPEKMVIAEELDRKSFKLEGHDLVVVDVGASCTTRC